MRLETWYCDLSKMLQCYVTLKAASAISNQSFYKMMSFMILKKILPSKLTNLGTEGIPPVRRVTLTCHGTMRPAVTIPHSTHLGHLNIFNTSDQPHLPHYQVKKHTSAGARELGHLLQFAVQNRVSNSSKKNASYQTISLLLSIIMH